MNKKGLLNIDINFLESLLVTDFPILYGEKSPESCFFWKRLKASELGDNLIENYTE